MTLGKIHSYFGLTSIWAVCTYKYSMNVELDHGLHAKTQINFSGMNLVVKAARF